MVWSLWDENARRAESRLTYAPDSWYLQAYAEKFRLDRSAEKLQAAQAEIDQLVARGVLDPFYAQPDNFWSVLRNENFILFFLTSLAITASVVFLTIMLTSMTGYALARMRFPGKMLVLGLMIAGAVAPREAVIIPIFRLFKSLGALDGLWGMVVWMTGAGIGNTFLMAGFFMTLPKEVEEAAAVDGAGPFRTFFDVALPMARPIVMTVGLFAFLTAWNDFLVPLLCTVSNPSMQPLAVAVYNFQRGHPGKWHEINAAASVMIVPVILLFVLLQKHVVKGVAVGAVKG
jgi:raffinose/stachyose/melibiose transport system permease protein